MVTKEKVVVYPYDLSFAPFLRYSEFLSGIEIVGLVSPNGFGLTGKDAGCADGGSPVGITVSNKLETVLEQCDSVLFVESENKLDFDKFIFVEIQKAINAQKNIICCLKLEKSISENLSKLCETSGVVFRYMEEPDDICNYERNVNRLFEINVPIVFVTGLGIKCRKMHTQLALVSGLRCKGYKASCIASNRASMVLGFHSYPDFMFSQSKSEQQKIFAFNHFVKAIELKEEPDLIIIGIPGGIMPINSRFTNEFGLLAYEVSNAVYADTSVVCCYYQRFDADLFERLKNNSKYRLGADAACFAMANSSLLMDESIESKDLILSTIKPELVKSEVDALALDEILIVSAIEKENCKAAADHVIEKLASNAEVEAI